MILLLSTLGLAQDYTDAEVPPINAQRFRPTLDGKRTLWADDAQRGEHKTFFLRPLFHYTHRPLVYEYESGQRLALVGNIVQGNLMAGFSFDRLRVGIDAPVIFFAESETRPSQAGLGDLRVDGKVSILDGDAPLGLAVQGLVAFPTGLRTIPLGARKTTWEASLIVDTDVAEKLYLMANLGYRGGPDAQLENVRVNDFFTFRAAAAYAINNNDGVALEFSGDVPFTGTNTIDALPIEGLLSGYARVAPDLKLRGGIGTSLTRGIAAPQLRVMLGFSWEKEADLDADDDGILDEADQCIDVPEDLDGEQDEDGCPEAIGSIQLQVVDEAGQPLAAKSAITGTDLTGGTSLAATLEAGSYEATATAEGYEPGKIAFTVADEDVDTAVVLQLSKVVIPMGTLEVVVKDQEGNDLTDGVVVRLGDDFVESGAEVSPGEYRVTASANGFRIPDPKQVTIEDGEKTVVEFVLEPAQAKVEGERIDLRDSVYFDTNKATIQERSYGLLDDVAGILADHPELTKIRIEGHTDSRGSAKYNKELSQKRADSVKQYMLDKGIEAERLEAVGYGEERPLEKGENAAAWDKNRRVDFFVAERAD